MKTEIIPFEREHGAAIIERNVKEGKIKPPEMDIGSQFTLYENGGPSYTLKIDGEPVFCAGVVILKWRQGEAWTLLSSLFYEYKKTCYKAIKNYLETIARDAKLRRVQAFTEINANGTESFMRHLGFEKEAIIHCFGPVGQDLVLYWRKF